MRETLFKFKATFSHVNKRFSVRSEYSAEWKSALNGRSSRNFLFNSNNMHASILRSPVESVAPWEYGFIYSMVENNLKQVAYRMRFVFSSGRI